MLRRGEPATYFAIFLMIIVFSGGIYLSKLVIQDMPGNLEGNMMSGSASSNIVDASALPGVQYALTVSLLLGLALLGGILYKTKS